LIPLYTHVTENEKRRADRGVAEGRVTGDEECDPELGFNPIPKEIDNLDVEVRHV
jgi:hypothetical protein